MGIASDGRRVRGRYCELREGMVFERWNEEKALYTDVASVGWRRATTKRRAGWSERNLHLEIAPSGLEAIGLQIDDSRRISLRSPESRFVRGSKNLAKYVLGVGIPLIGGYLLGDYLAGGNESSPDLIRWICYGIGVGPGILAAGVVASVIRDRIRTGVPELKKVKRILKKHAREIEPKSKRDKKWQRHIC